MVAALAGLIAVWVWSIVGVAGWKSDKTVVMVSNGGAMYAERHQRAARLPIRWHGELSRVDVWWWPRVIWDSTRTLVFVPLWMVAGLGGAVAVLVWRKTRLGATVCWACGYDKRGLTGARCPECGVE
jgi:hypothetical protein